MDKLGSETHFVHQCKFHGDCDGDGTCKWTLKLGLSEGGAKTGKEFRIRISHRNSASFSTRTNIDEEVAITIPSIKHANKACLTYIFNFVLDFTIFIKQKKKILEDGSTLL